MPVYQPAIYLLWDDSHIWGLLAARAVMAMGLPHKLVRASEIADGLLTGTPPSLLLVPGGNARHKAQSLGSQGIGEIRNYVGNGGKYLGFCGGAGLALTWGENSGGPAGLGLCPWKRARFEERVQHFMSGHLHVALPERKAGIRSLLPDGMPESPPLPVWWPGRFDARAHPGITVMASYERPADDFWLADLPIADLPPDTFASWRDLYGLSFTPTFLAGQPCLVHGEYGSGGYIISYSHLETPGSTWANHWFAHILARFGNVSPAVESVPPWNMDGEASPAWSDPFLDALRELWETVERTGLKHGMLFHRTDWLLGWRTGIPGASLNNIRAALFTIAGREPSEGSLAFWKSTKDRLLRSMEVFSKGCVQYLLAERLAMTLSKSHPDALPASFLKEQREALFGPPMHAGGLYREIIEQLDRLAFLQLTGRLS